MKQKFALLTIVGALLALAVPAVSSASMFPAGAKFEFGGEGSPKLATSLGSCGLKITGQVPAAPANEAASLLLAIPTPTVVGCKGGASVTLTGAWSLTAGGHTVALVAPGSQPEAAVLRFSSLPSCKLVGTPGFIGIWSNGITTSTLVKSIYHAHATVTYTWANDGGACALAGSNEPVLWEGGVPTNGTAVVNNLTTPTVPILVGS
jgi:hypothetical protein